VVDDDVPASVTDVASSTPGCSVTGNHVHCVGSPLGHGTGRNITITGRAPDAAGSVVNTATIAPTTEADPNPENNSDTSTTRVQVAVVSGACRGTPLAALGLRIGEANGAETPCRTDSHSLLRVDGTTLLSPLPINAYLIDGKTLAGPRFAAAASDIVDTTIRVGTLVISAKGVHSEVMAGVGPRCDGATAAAKSRIATLVINGKPYYVGEAPMVIPLVVGTVYVNTRIVSGSSAHAWTVIVDLPGTALDVVLGESKARVACKIE
jgi:hypothetical protein